MQRRMAGINDLPLEEAQRKFRWRPGRRPDDRPGLSGLGL
jgi:nuclear transport factor 2 (NTF2) superfamily protein